MPKLNHFSLYLAKPRTADFDELLTETARNMLKAGNAKRIASGEFADGAVLYVFPGELYPPEWVSLLSPSFKLPGDLLARSPCALMAFKKENCVFVLTFSRAHVYLNDAKTEADFGLKVAINAVSDEKLRSVERSNIGAAIRDFAQAAGQRDLGSFGFNDALDLIRKVSGRAADDEFANLVTGSRALRFSKKIDLSEVPHAALEAVAFFKSTAYKKTRFQIIDLLTPILDSTTESVLNDNLTAAIREGTDEFEITIPEIVSERIGSFRFERAHLSRFYPDLSLQLYCEGLGPRLAKLSLEDLNNHTVAAYAEYEKKPFKSWSVHQSLVGSIVLHGERYALNEGYWYRIDEKFKQAADHKFNTLCAPPDRKFRPLRKIVFDDPKGGKKKVTYQSEESYNAEIATETGYLLMDRKLIRIDEMPGPGIEACDLLDIHGRRFIHVKKSSRQSSVLSHFLSKEGTLHKRSANTNRSGQR